MSIVSVGIIWDGKDQAWFTANATEVFDANITIFCNEAPNYGQYKFTDGITQLSALPWMAGSGSALTFQNGLTESGGNVELGGNLIQDTFIDGNYNLTFGDGTKLNEYQIFTTTSLRANVDNGVDVNNFEIQPTLTQLDKQVYLPDGTADSVLITDGSNNIDYITLGANQSIRRNSANTAYEAFTPASSSQIFTIQCNYGLAGHTANTSYWFSSNFALGRRTSVGQTNVSNAYNSKLVGASISAWNSAGAISQVNSTLNILVNGTPNVISNSVLWPSLTANSSINQNITGLNISVLASDSWELRIDIGNLATPPGFGNLTVTLYFEI